jgi:4-hydroxybenzoate polyprenyltransferase
MSATQTSTDRHPVVAYAALVRLPNLFTAPPDVVLGAALASVAVDSVSTVGVAGLALASVLLYAAGTTLNDYADAEEDARERPERPIPSGDISRRVALFVGVVLLTTGVEVAIVAGGAAGGATAGALALAVLLYDGVFKGSAVGFLFMGASRGLNVLLGVAAAGVAPTELPAWILAIPALVGIYIAAVTYMAEGETGADGRGPVLAAIGGATIATLGVVALLAARRPPPVAAAVAVVLLVAFLVWIGRPLRAAYADPTPEVIGPAVGACVLGLTPLDAAVAAVAGPAWALATVAFVVPAAGLSRVFDVT